MAIYRIFKERVFEPEAVICMAKAYEGVLVARNAELGERDPGRLRDRALKELSRKDT
jgi:hypothetical protein